MRAREGQSLGRPRMLSVLVIAVTPVLARPYHYKTMQPKTPPILWDRTPSGQIIVPAYLVHNFIERVVLPQVGPDSLVRLAHRHPYQDILLPASTNTVACPRAQDGVKWIVEGLAPGTPFPIFDRWVHPQDRTDAQFLD
jgi:hypothetical protein